ncbi:MAG TPA: hypothetical protein VGI39_14645 [Polyangiaceae bacterium]|jgi:hypothetical protein
MGFRSLTRPADPTHAPHSRFGAWRARMSERLARSSRVFLLGVVVACGIEVLVDWNQTLFEINVLRNAIREKGENYVGILGKASDDELAAGDRQGLERLTHGIFDDEDVIYVRFTDANGKVIWDKFDPDLPPNLPLDAATLARRFGPLMARDTERALHDPAGLETRVANSRYKDFAQAWTDATAKVVAKVVPSKPAPPRRGVVIYQDRLRDEFHQKDDSISYAIGTVVGEDGKDIGTVIVAFAMARTNDAVHVKYLKFAGLVTFFVGLILVQNVVARRNRLRLLDVQAKYATAKQALREEMPHEDVRAGALVASGAVEQARGAIDGMAWSAVDEGRSLLVLVVDPDGDGIDAAAVGLHVLRRFRRPRAGASPSLDDELRILGEAAREIPLTRPIEALLLRLDRETGAFEARGGRMAQLRIVGAQGVVPTPLVPWDEEVPEGLVGPLYRASGTLPARAALVATFTDPGALDARVLADGVAKFLARVIEPSRPVAAQDAAIWARGKNAALAERDIAVVSVARTD